VTVFVDTGPWYASVVPSDPRHPAVTAWHADNNWPLVTTDYVVDETLTLSRAGGERARAVALGRHFFDLAGVAIHHVDEGDLRRAWAVFRDNPRRDWSFTDCVSRAVIERLHLKRALTGIHLMRTGEVEANLVTLNAHCPLPQVPDLIARKLAGPEQSTLAEDDVEFHRDEYDRLRGELQASFEASRLPELPSAKPALHDLLLRPRST